MANQLLATKSLDRIEQEMEGGHRLKRALGPLSLTALGIGAIIGTGIFVLVGKAASQHAGPALILSFVVAGLACVFAAFCYAEFASMTPVAGSAYTYAYATMGELMAWIIGWDLVLEYAVASATVAHGWSAYFQKLLALFGVGTFVRPDKATGAVGGPLYRFTDAPFDYANSTFFQTPYLLDLPAVVIAAIVTAVLVRGVRESAAVNAVMVAIKVIVVLFVIAVGAFFVTTSNWTPFAPYGYGGVKLFGTPVFGGTEGMMAGAAAIIFAYLGFDAVSTQAEEAKNPKRDVPIGIIGSLVICTVLYIAMASVVTGMVPYEHVDMDAPVASAIATPSRRESFAPGQLVPDKARWEMEPTTRRVVVQRLGEAKPLPADGKVPEGAQAAETKDGAAGYAEWLPKLTAKPLPERYKRTAERPEDRFPPNAVPRSAGKDAKGEPIDGYAETLPEMVFADGLRVPEGRTVRMMADRQLTVAEPVRESDRSVRKALAIFVTIGALTGITSVLVVMMMGQPRIFLAMARDGLLPIGFFGAVHPRFQTPWKSTLLTGLIVATAASLLPLNILADLVNIGTLFAFAMVCGAVLVMRYAAPDHPRPFKTPFFPVFPILGIVLCVALMLSLPPENWLRLFIWLAIGLAIYFGYGYWHSKLRPGNDASVPPAGPAVTA